jgi:hypothetical protein
MPVVANTRRICARLAAVRQLPTSHRPSLFLRGNILREIDQHRGASSTYIVFRNHGPYPVEHGTVWGNLLPFKFRISRCA